MNLFGLAGLSLALFLSLLILVILIHDPKRWLSRIFVIYCFTIVIWGLGIYKITQAQIVTDAFLWWRLAHIGVILIPVLFVHFIYTFLNITRRTLIRCAYFIGVLFLILNATPYFITNMRYVFGEFYYASPPSILYILFVIFFSFLIIHGHYLLFRHYFDSQTPRVQKQQTRLLFIISTLTYIGGTTAFFPVFGIDWYPAIGTFLVSPYAIVIYYGILRHRLFYIKAVIAEIFTVITWMIFIAVFFLANTVKERIFDSILFVTAIILGTFAIKSTLRESLQKEQLEDLSKNLQKKVDEQTQEIQKAYGIEKKARIELEALDKAKDQFLLTTQHHLRTPITIAKGYLSSFLKKKGKSLDAESKSDLERVENAVERMNGLVKELLDISQIQVESEALKKEKVKIEKLIRSVMESMHGIIHEKLLKVYINVPSDITLSIDVIRFKEALIHLIDNAVKYNKINGTISIFGEIVRHSIEREKELFRLTIEDTGIGIAEKDLPQLFTQYFQRGEEAEKLYTTGKGLALIVVRNIIQAHGGRIWAESDGVGKGARFIIELPV